jgi:uncharacterized protein
VSSKGFDPSEGTAGPVEIRAYAELNDYLPPGQRYRTFTIILDGEIAVSSLLGRVGIPTHVVDLVLRNSEPAGFGDPVSSGDRVSVYPVFETFDISAVQRLRPKPLRSPAFVLDVHLGKLATYLRLLGFDALYSPTYHDEQLVSISTTERRILLSKDRILLGDPRLERAATVRADSPESQLREVVHGFNLEVLIRPFTRCLVCNTLLVSVGKNEILDSIPPHVRETRDRFTQCPDCKRIFWEGSHYNRMVKFISSITGQSAIPPERRE